MLNNDRKQADDMDSFYDLINQQLAGLIEGERQVIANLANAAALLFNELSGINWAGFYIYENSELLLGPFQGKPACVHIPIGRGVCGRAWMEDRTFCVSNVHTFTGHIACDKDSKSEIVVPMHDSNSIVAVLDIDSPIYDRFSLADQKGLERFVEILSSGCDWQK